ncbi:F17e-G fimbrial adhesin precursor [Serratia fonticola]|jgi:hypothetical protein|uniref:fimbrial protein n=1 Tax=Serratia TaxID=613 RepID=UPI000AFEB6B3|nr:MULTISPECIES: fimbrial protein [Serratia]MCO7510000.1 type 1 fimbrial protein [Serratia fonticola]CAI1542504.1 F17e-G fimbrial adhesin precursor [Serratia fonticola]
MNIDFQKMINNMKTKQISRARLFALSLCGVALTLLGTSQAYADSESGRRICNPSPAISLTFPPLVFDGGADGPTIGQPINSGWGTSLVSPNYFSGDDCLISIGVSLPTAQGTRPTGQTYTEGGVTYPVYRTNIANIGLILGIKATSAANYVPIVFPATYFYPVPTPSQNMGISVQAKLIVIGRLTSGVYPIEAQSLFSVYANGQGDKAADGGELILNASTVTIKASTCQMVGGTSQSVPLLPVGKTQFSGEGSSAGAPADFKLTTLCGSGVKLYATMTDGSDPGNTGNILKPAEGTTASGVSVQILRDGLPISFGPDSSASGNTNQWYIGTANSGGSEVFTIPLKARYVQTEANMVAGAVKARTTVTFSYQ